MAVDPLDMGVSLSCPTTNIAAVNINTHETTTNADLRRLAEPYDRHRAHDLRAECYRRGIRPIKKGPHANDNKAGYMALLRRWDVANKSGSNVALQVNGMTRMPPVASTSQALGQVVTMPVSVPIPAPVVAQLQDPLQQQQQQQQQHPTATAPATTLHTGQTDAHPERKKRKATASRAAGANSNDGSRGPHVTDLAGAGSASTFFDAAALMGAASTSSILPASVPLTYANAAPTPAPTAAPANIATAPAPAQAHPASALAPAPAKTQNDLEILSRIANSYTNQIGLVDGHSHPNGSMAWPTVGIDPSLASLGAGASSHLCSNCRSHVTDQLMESIRLGRTKLLHQQQEKRVEIQLRQATLMREILEILQRLHQMQRDMVHSAAAVGFDSQDEDELRELEQDIAFYRELKRKTRKEMKLVMQQQDNSHLVSARTATTGNNSSSSESNEITTSSSTATSASAIS